MTATAPIPPGLSLASTLWFPLSGNPIGFNHFAAAEWLLRRAPQLARVCFVLSNGHHPDPTKRDAIVPAEERAALCAEAIAAVGDPARSFLARQAELAGETLRVGPRTLAVSTLEFAFQRAVRTAELVPLLRAQEPGHAGRLAWCAGSDLVERMAERRIFADADLATLAAHCHYHVLERPDAPLEAALARLEAGRGVRLDCTPHPLAELPPWLAPFLALSSTCIRHAAEAGDPLAGMLPAPAAERIAARGLYRAGEPGARLVAPDGRELGARSLLALHLDALQGELEAQAARIHGALTERAAAGRPHGLALVETSTGGLLTAALAGRSGASRYFRQARFAYDAHAKTTLLGGALPGTAVSEEAALALARALRAAAGADYALAESGMAGPPDAGRRSLKYGLCCLAVAGPDGERTRTVHRNPFLTRREHQLHFAREALALLEESLAGRSACG